MKKARAGILRKLNRVPLLAPFLVGISVVANAMTLVQPNFDWQDVGIALAIVTAATAIITWLCYRVFKRPATAAFTAALSLILLAYFNTIEAKLLEWLLNSPLRFMARAVIIITMIGIIYTGLVWWFNKKVSQRRRINLALNMAAATMVCLPIFQSLITCYKYRDILLKTYWSELGTMTLLGINKPDIYFIIFDSYTGNECLLKYWDYDNVEFINYLKKCGFHVVENARTKYNSTQISIASILNMTEYTYLNVGNSHKHKLLFENMAFKYIKNGEVIRRLEDMNYSIVNLSLFKLSNEKRFYRIKNFSIGTIENIWEHSLPYFIFKLMPKNYDDYFPFYYPKVNMNIYYRILDMHCGKESNPKYVYAHFNLPHNPYTFNRNGGNVVLDGEKSEKELYLEQLIYATQLASNIIKNIKEKNKDAIIIIQGDHGSRILTSQKECQDESYSILNAMYLPGSDSSWFWDGMQPVDTFRLIFNKYFGANYPYLSKPDDSHGTNESDKVVGELKIEQKLK